MCACDRPVVLRVQMSVEEKEEREKGKTRVWRENGREIPFLLKSSCWPALYEKKVQEDKDCYFCSCLCVDVLS